MVAASVRDFLDILSPWGGPPLPPGSEVPSGQQNTWFCLSVCRPDGWKTRRVSGCRKMQQQRNQGTRDMKYGFAAAPHFVVLVSSGFWRRRPQPSTFTSSVLFWYQCFCSLSQPKQAICGSSVLLHCWEDCSDETQTSGLIGSSKQNFGPSRNWETGTD